ncbi:MAG: hypothetical protein WAT79_14785 [Saprospiraceae bacterium]
MVSLVLFLSACQKNEKENTQKNSPTTQSIGTELRSNVCYEELLEIECPNSTPTIEVHTLDNIPGYPSGCTFKVKVKIVKCNIPNTLITRFFTLSFELIEVNCPQYENEINEILFNPGINTPSLDEYLTELYDKLYRRFEDVHFEDFKIFFNCGAQNQWFEISHIRESCSRYCVYLTGREGYYLATPIPCGTGCCKIETKMCFNQSSQKVEKTTIIVPLSIGQCDPPSPTTPFGCFTATECRFICTQ